MTDTRSCAVCTRVRYRPCHMSTCAIRCVNLSRTPKRVIRLECRCLLRTRPPVAPLNACDRCLEHSIVSRIRQHCATVAKSARPQSLLAARCSVRLSLPMHARVGSALVRAFVFASAHASACARGRCELCAGASGRCVLYARARVREHTPFNFRRLR